jgi:hypothetical protein
VKVKVSWLAIPSVALTCLPASASGHSLQSKNIHVWVTVLANQGKQLWLMRWMATIESGPKGQLAHVLVIDCMCSCRTWVSVFLMWQFLSLILWGILSQCLVIEVWGTAATYVHRLKVCMNTVRHACSSDACYQYKSQLINDGLSMFHCCSVFRYQSLKNI